MICRFIWQGKVRYFFKKFKKYLSDFLEITKKAVLLHPQMGR